MVATPPGGGTMSTSQSKRFPDGDLSTDRRASAVDGCQSRMSQFRLADADTLEFRSRNHARILSRGNSNAFFRRASSIMNFKLFPGNPENAWHVPILRLLSLDSGITVRWVLIPSLSNNVLFLSSSFFPFFWEALTAVVFSYPLWLFFDPCS